MFINKSVQQLYIGLQRTLEGITELFTLIVNTNNKIGCRWLSILMIRREHGSKVPFISPSSSSNTKHFCLYSLQHTKMLQSNTRKKITVCNTYDTLHSSCMRFYYYQQKTNTAFQVEKLVCKNRKL